MGRRRTGRLLAGITLGVLPAIGAGSWSVWLHPQPQRREAIKVVATVCWTSPQATPTQLVQMPVREDHHEPD
jgi:hypothetical protein